MLNNFIWIATKGLLLRVSVLVWIVSDLLFFKFLAVVCSPGMRLIGRTQARSPTQLIKEKHCREGAFVWRKRLAEKIIIVELRKVQHSIVQSCSSFNFVPGVIQLGMYY